MAICQEKPDSLPSLKAIGLEPADQKSYPMTRGGSERRHPIPTSSPRPPVGLGINASSGFGKTLPPQFPTMGNFGTPTKLGSEDRFLLPGGTRVSSGPSGLPYGRPVPITRSGSQGGPGAAPGSAIGSHRTRSKRGEKGDESNKVAGGPQGHGLGFETSTEIVDRQVRSLLNKLTMEKFNSISDQIIAWANKSEKERNGRTLMQVVKLVFEKATDEATWSEMYARLCRKMMEQISPNVQDDGIKNPEGKPIAGGQLFRKYLLNRCQEDFERGWVAKETTAAAAATKAIEDQAAAAKASSNKSGNEEEIVLYSEEYYAAQKAKRPGLGLIKFIGELFKVQMLSERIMHEYVKKLLGNVENPEEEEIESLCKLLATVGSLLDTDKARRHMDVYFSRIKESVKSPNVSARMQFMLQVGFCFFLPYSIFVDTRWQDVIELRERNWVTRNTVAAPAAIQRIREAVSPRAHLNKWFQTQILAIALGRQGKGSAGEGVSPAANEHVTRRVLARG